MWILGTKMKVQVKNVGFGYKNKGFGTKICVSYKKVGFDKNIGYKIQGIGTKMKVLVQKLGFGIEFDDQF